MKFKKKKEEGSSLHLTDKKHPAMGITAAAFGIVSIATFISLCFVSSQSHGNAGILIGFAGIVCFVLSMIGFVLSWLSLRQDNIRVLFPTIAAIINGLSSVFYFLLYLWGNLV